MITAIVPFLFLFGVLYFLWRGFLYALDEYFKENPTDTPLPPDEMV